MRILRLSTLSLTLAIAAFSLGYVNPSFAGKPVDGKHDHGGGDGGGTVTTFSVAVVAGTGDGNWVVMPVDVRCEGQTDSQKLTFFFPESDPDCLDGAVMIGGIAWYLHAIAVREKKTDVMLFFTNMPIEYPISTDVYNTGRLSADIVELDGGPSFEIQVNMTGLFLIKAEQPGRGDLEGPIAVGKIVFTANQ